MPWFLVLVENNQSKFRYLRAGLVGKSDTFGGAAPPDEMLTCFLGKAKEFHSQHEAMKFAKSHELARFGSGYQADPHLEPTEPPEPTYRRL